MCCSHGRTDGQNFSRQCGLDWNALAERITSAFRGAIVGAYYDPIRITPSPGVSYADLGRRFGVNRGTVQRWVEKGTYPSFEDFCFLSTAQNAAFRSGNVVALGAYRTVFRMIEAELAATRQWVRSELRIHDDELLCLYHIIRCRTWWKAERDKSTALRKAAVREISCQITEVLDDHRIRNVRKVNRILREWLKPWQILESILHYEHF